MSQTHFLTLGEIEEESTGPIWAINRTQGKDRGPVSFNVPRTNSRGNDTVTIPVSFLPVDLTEQVVRAALVQSTEFRRALRLQVIALLTNERAEELMNMKGAQQERDRISQELQSVPMDIATAHMGVTVNDANVTDPQEENEDGRVEGVLAAVFTAMSELSERDEVSVVNTLRALTDEMDARDYNYIISKAEDSKLSSLKKFAANRLRTLNT